MSNELKEIHSQVIDAVKNVHLLHYCSWPLETEQGFLASYTKGNLPKINFKYPEADFSDNKKFLEKLLPKLSKDEPLHIYTTKTIKSYILAIDMIHNRETKAFQKLSIDAFGE